MKQAENVTLDIRNQGGSLEVWLLWHVPGGLLANGLVMQNDHRAEMYLGEAATMEAALTLAGAFTISAARAFRQMAEEAPDGPPTGTRLSTRSYISDTEAKTAGPGLALYEAQKGLRAVEKKRSPFEGNCPDCSKPLPENIGDCHTGACKRRTGAQLALEREQRRLRDKARMAENPALFCGCTRPLPDGRHVMACPLHKPDDLVYRATLYLREQGAFEHTNPTAAKAIAMRRLMDSGVPEVEAHKAVAQAFAVRETPSERDERRERAAFESLQAGKIDCLDESVKPLGDPLCLCDYAMTRSCAHEKVSASGSFDPIRRRCEKLTEHPGSAPAGDPYDPIGYCSHGVPPWRNCGKCFPTKREADDCGTKCGCPGSCKQAAEEDGPE